MPFNNNNNKKKTKTQIKSINYKKLKSLDCDSQKPKKMYQKKNFWYASYIEQINGCLFTLFVIQEGIRL